MSAEDPIREARREVLLIAYTRLGVPSELSVAFEAAVDELEAKVRADERDRWKARLEESAAWYDRQQEVTHADTRLDPEDVAQVLRGFALVEEARGGE